jgi:hypothetical protein
MCVITKSDGSGEPSAHKSKGANKSYSGHVGAKSLIYMVFSFAIDKHSSGGGLQPADYKYALVSYPTLTQIFFERASI